TIANETSSWEPGHRTQCPGWAADVPLVLSRAHAREHEALSWCARNARPSDGLQTRRPDEQTGSLQLRYAGRSGHLQAVRFRLWREQVLSQKTRPRLRFSDF